MSRRLLVEADGGSRGNPGPAGCGAVVRDEATGALVAEEAVGLGETTNNVAEYRGLISGLRAAQEHGATSVHARMDSKLVIEQMSGRWKVKHANLQPLAREAAALVRAIGEVTFEWVPRKDNKHADRLANEAMDEQAGTGGVDPGEAQSAGTESAGTGSAGTGSAGTGSAGTGSAGTGSAGTGSAGTGSAGTGSAGTGSAGTGSVGTGSAGTGSAGTGSAATRSARNGPAAAESGRTGPARTAPAAASARESAPGSGSTAQPSAWTGAVGSPTRLVLLRHGQTRLSVDRRYSGRGEVPLTELGEQQARAAAKRLADSSWLDGAGFDGAGSQGAGSGSAGGVPVLSSPLGRARQTAEAVVEATGAELSLHDGLLETDFGDWEGLSFREAAEQYPELHGSWLGNPAVAPPSGESMDAVFERVGAFCAEVLRSHAGRTAVVVSHVTPIKALLRIGLDVGPSLFYRLHLDLASLSIVDFYPDGNASVRLVNDTSHLQS